MSNEQLSVCPNPSFGSVRIKYGVPEKSVVSLMVYNKLEKIVKIFYSDIQQKGKYEIRINSGHTGTPILNKIFLRYFDIFKIFLRYKKYIIKKGGQDEKVCFSIYSSFNGTSSKGRGYYY